MGDEHTWDGSRAADGGHGHPHPGMARCALCGRDISDLADADCWRDEFGLSVLCWCPECAAAQVGHAWPDAGYLPVRHLGSGLHVTWQMWDPATGRVLAVRRIPFWTRREENVRRYVEESQPLLGLVHPRVTRLLDLRACAGAVLVASPYVPGGNLWDWLLERGPASPALSVRGVRGLLDGLRQLHALGVAHGNIHPWNVLLPEGNPQAAQLCLAGRAFPGLLDTLDPEAGSPPPTVRNLVAPAFAGPQRLLGQYQASPAADLYALGQVLYLLLTGELALELPWRSGAAPDVGRWLGILRDGEPVSACARRPDLPPALAQVVDRAVAKDPAARFQGVDELVLALEALGDLQPDLGAPPPGPSATMVTPERPSPAGPTPRGRGEEAVPLEWRVGETILGLYEVKDVFTSGGMGLVYRVHHRAWDLDLAVKCPRPEYFRVEAQKQDFIREAETWMDLGLHPHIVTCHYVRTLGSIPRVFAEFMEGGSLKDWVRDRRLYAGGQDAALERILDVAVQFAWGLAYAHEQGLVHQDVKPANVLMAPDGTAKVTDFGLARACAAAGDPGDVPAGGSDPVSAGDMALAYCSPEQAAGERLTRGTDTWSWGVSVLEMFSGRVTWFSGQAAPAILEMLLQEGPAVEGPPPMPTPLADLLRQCFQQDPAARPTSMAEVAAQLVETYRQVVSQEYPRQLPEAAGLRAGSLNNRALSLLDLGREEEALAAWGQALAVDPHHLQATYNAGLYRWQAAQITDQDLVRQLEAVALSQPGAWLPRYLLAQIHLQRSDLEAGRAALDVAARLPPGAPEVQAALARLDETPSMRCLRALEGHTEQVCALAISPDGRRAVSGAGDNTLRVWDLASGGCLRTLMGHADAVLGVAITPDGQRAVSAGLDRTLRLWDLSSGECLRTLEQHREYSEETPRGLRAVAITPDGKQAISGGHDSALRLWDLTGGDLVRTLEGHSGPVCSVAVTPDGRCAVSGGKDRALRLWDLSNGVCLRTLEGHMGQVLALGLAPDGSVAVSAGHDKTLRVWDLASGACLRTLVGHQGGVTSVAISPDGQWAVSGSSDGTVRLWDLASGVCLRTLEGHTGEVTAVAVHPDGRRAVSASEDRSLRLWQVGAARFGLPWASSRTAELGEVRAATAGKELEAARLALSSGQAAEAARALARALQTPGFEHDRAALELWHAAGSRVGRRKGLRLTPRRLRTLEGHTGDVLVVACTPDGRRAISGSADDSLRVWDLPSGECLHTLQGHTGMVQAVAVTSDGRWALSGGSDKTLRVWDLASGACLRALEGHSASVEAVAAIPGGCLAVSIGYRDTLRVWDLASGECLHTVKVQADPSLRPGRGLSVTPDGRWAISGGDLSALKVWDLARGRYSRTLEVHKEPRQIFGLDGFAIAGERRAVSISKKNTVRVWDLASGACLSTLQGHRSFVADVALTLDGHWAVSGDELTLRVWDLASSACLATLQSGERLLRSVALTPDGHYLLAGGLGTIGQWVLDWDYEFPEAADWDEGARPHLESFLALHTPARRGLFQRSRPEWTTEHFAQLLAEMGLRGYGWLRPEGVRLKLEAMARERT